MEILTKLDELPGESDLLKFQTLRVSTSYLYEKQSSNECALCIVNYTINLYRKDTQLVVSYQ